MTAAPCPVCDGHPRVLVAVRHPVMRRYTTELLAREHQCWETVTLEPDEMLVDAIDRVRPELLVVDDGDFPACCQRALNAFPRDRVVVVGRLPDDAYEHAARRHGAGGWISRDRVGDDLSSAMRRMLGCVHDPCPDPVAGNQPDARLDARTVATPAERP